MKHNADGRGFPHFYNETYFLTRGDVGQKREQVEPGFLPVLERNGYSDKHWSVAKPKDWSRTSFQRAAVARWLTDVEHGAGHLAARVIVNRLWQHHFGTGIVATPNDFGAQGAAPSHPELLEWLAVDLVQNGWNLKRIHRLIMNSAVYMQTSDPDPLRARLDRENRGLWRFPTRRVDAEVVRDTLLAISGRLDPTMFGPGTLDPAMHRRSIYFFIKRSQLIPMMVLFDWPEHQVSIGQRGNTTVAPQALALMNSPQCRDYAEGLAERVAGDSIEKSVDRAYEIALARKPTVQEKALAMAFIDRQTDVHATSETDRAKRLAIVDFCQVILSMNELIYVD